MFIGYFMDKPLISYTDDNVVNITLVGFSGIETSRTLFFYECSDRDIKLPEHELFGRNGKFEFSQII